MSAPTEVANLDALGAQVWAPLPDGRFILGRPGDTTDEITSFHVVQNGAASVKRRLATAN